MSHVLSPHQFASLSADYFGKPVEQPVASQGTLFTTEPPLNAPPKTPTRSGVTR